MKRFAGFVPLSREHHDGLLLATRLQQGRNALLRMWSHDLHWQAEYVVKFFDDNLETHFAAEEEAVFPEAEACPGGGELAAALIAQHKELRAMAEFLRRPDEKKLECTLVQFGQTLEEHIRREERELFPLMESTLSEERLEAVGRALRARTGDA